MLAAGPRPSYPCRMVITLSPLPLIPHPRFDAWLMSLPAEDREAIAPSIPALGPLLESAPYLFDLAQANAGWLAATLAITPDNAFAAIIDAVTTAGKAAPDEDTLSPILRL